MLNPTQYMRFLGGEVSPNLWNMADFEKYGKWFANAENIYVELVRLFSFQNIELYSLQNIEFYNLQNIVFYRLSYNKRLQKSSSKVKKNTFLTKFSQLIYAIIPISIFTLLHNIIIHKNCMRDHSISGMLTGART